MGVRLTWVQQAAGAIRRWRIQFRIRGSRRESAVAAFYVGDAYEKLEVLLYTNL